MNATFSCVIVTLAAFGFGLVPAFARENKHRPLRWKINVYLAYVATWAAVILATSYGCYLETETQTMRDNLWNVAQPAIIILVPTAIIAAAMWKIGRSPTLEELTRRHQNS